MTRPTFRAPLPPSEGFISKHTLTVLLTPPERCRIDPGKAGESLDHGSSPPARNSRDALSVGLTVGQHHAAAT